MTPDLTHEAALALVHATEHQINFTKYPAGFFLAIRGYYRDSQGAVGQNDVGILDDILAWVSPTEIKAIQGNTDPTRVGWNAKLGKPFAMLVPGLYYFIRGAHNNRRPCFRQPDEDQAKIFSVPNRGFVKVYRAKALNQIEQHTAPIETGYFAINIHDMLGETTSSWGCLTAPHDTFVPWAAWIWKHTRAHGQDVLPLILIENPPAPAPQLETEVAK